MSKVRFIHISDLHFSKRSNKYGLNDILKILSKSKKVDKLGLYTSHDILKLKSLVDVMIKDEKHVDFLLITGDIATSSSNDDLELSSKLITNNVNIYNSKKENYDDFSIDELNKIKNIEDLELFIKVRSSVGNCIALAHKSIVLLPGNHDKVYSDKSTFFSGNFYTNDDFKNHFPTFWNPKNSNTKRIHSQAIKIKDSEKKLLFIKIDCSFDRALIPFYEVGMGEFSNSIEDDLISVLEKVKLKKEEGEKYIPIVTLHYLPHSSTKKELELWRSKNFLNILKKFGIKYLFCGHTHKNSKFNYCGIEIYCSSSTLSTKDDRSRINIFEYDSVLDRLIIDKHYFWEKKFQKFELQKT